MVWIPSASRCLQGPAGLKKILNPDSFKGSGENFIGQQIYSLRMPLIQHHIID